MSSFNAEDILLKLRGGTTSSLPLSSSTSSTGGGGINRSSSSPHHIQAATTGNAISPSNNHKPSSHLNKSPAPSSSNVNIHGHGHVAIDPLPVVTFLESAAQRKERIESNLEREQFIKSLQAEILQLKDENKLLRDKCTNDRMASEKILLNRNDTIAQLRKQIAELTSQLKELSEGRRISKKTSKQEKTSPQKKKNYAYTLKSPSEQDEKKGTIPNKIKSPATQLFNQMQSVDEFSSRSDSSLTNDHLPASSSAFSALSSPDLDHHHLTLSSLSSDLPSSQLHHHHTSHHQPHHYLNPAVALSLSQARLELEDEDDESAMSVIEIDLSLKNAQNKK